MKLFSLQENAYTLQDAGTNEHFAWKIYAKRHITLQGAVGFFTLLVYS